MRIHAAAAALLVIAAPIASAAAQESARTGGPRIEGLSFPGPGDLALIKPAVVARALPRSFQVVEIVVPAEVSLSQPVPYTIDPAGSTPLLGRRSGLLAPGVIDPVHPRSVLVTFSVPKHAPAGLIEVARVRFLPAGGTPVEVPVNVIVEPTQQVQLTVGEALRGVRPGERFTLTYRVTNLGNTPEQIEVKAVLPAGWSLVTSGPATRLGINGMIEQQMTIGVPFNSGTGSSSVRLIAYAGGAPVATADALVDVVLTQDRRSSGPVVSTAMSYGWDPAGQLASGYTVGIAGQITDSLQITARMSNTPQASTGAGYALSQVGFYQTPPMLELTAPHWRLGLGLTGSQFSQLTGVGAYGDGISADVSHHAWHASMLLARPGYGTMPDSGLFAGGRVEMTTGSMVLSGTAIHLDDQQGATSRSLDALAVGASSAHIWEGTLAGELAERWTAMGASPGWSMAYERRVQSDNLSVRVLHAPGGSTAFAQAADQIFASGGHALSRHLSLNGSFSTSSDNAGVGFGDLHTSNWSAGPQLQLTNSLGFSLSARRSSFSASGATGAFNTGETGADAAATFRKGRIYVTSFGTVVQATNETSLPTGGRLAEMGLRSTLNTTVGINTNRGVFEFSSLLAQNGRGSGQLPQQMDLSIRAERVPIIARRSMQVYVDAALRRTYTPGFTPARTFESVGVNAMLPLGFSIGLSAQRNPFLLAGTTAGGWLYGLKFGRGTSLPRLGSGTETRGIVYKDLNGNGVLDPGEPGIGGAVLRRGNESVVSEANGTYRFPGVMADSVRLDPTSLRVGLIAGTARQVGDRGEIAVIAVSPVEVELVRSADNMVQADSSGLSAIVVLARDESGKVWVARRSSSSIAVFDALPVGRYTVELDLADLQEKLEARTLPAFTVTGVQPVQRVRMVLHARPVDVKHLDTVPAPPGNGSRQP